MLIFCAACFYLHKFIPVVDYQVEVFQKEFKKVKKENSIALNKVKEYARGTEVYDNYLEVNQRRSDAYKKFTDSVKESKFFVFPSLHHFVERFGLMLCIFIYAMYNLIKSYLRERKNIGAKLIHSFIISICFFYFYWIFQSFQDLSKISYVLVTFISALTITLGVRITTKYYKERVNKIREQMFFIARLGLRNSKPEKKEEMLNVFRQVANDK